MTTTLDDTPYPSTLLDGENQPLSTGLTRFYKGQSCGKFWPQALSDWSLIKEKAKTVRMTDGTEFLIRVIEYNPSEIILGGHFDFEVLKAE